MAATSNLRMGRQIWVPISATILPITLALSGCGNPQRAATATSAQPATTTTTTGQSREPLVGVAAAVMRDAKGVAAFDANGVPLAGGALPGLPIGDWSEVVTAAPSGAATRLAWIDVRTRSEHASQMLPVAGVIPVLASPDGHLVALQPPPESPLDPADIAPSRERTRIVVARLGASEPVRTFDLSGNFVAEGFSSGGDTVYLIQYEPAIHPRKYRVRALTTATGDVTSLVTREKQPNDEEMEGRSRTQVFEPANKILFTLYSQPAASGPHAFVHTLGVDGGWVHCIDLPDPLGLGGAPAAITTSPDGSALFVAGAGHLLEISTQELTITRTADIGQIGEHPSVAATRTRIAVGSGRTLVILDRSTLKADRLVDLGATITGVTAVPNAVDSVLVALAGALLQVDLATGKVVARVPLPTGLTQLLGLRAIPVT